MRRELGGIGKQEGPVWGMVGPFNYIRGQDQLYNLWSPVQKGNEGSLVQKALGV